MNIHDLRDELPNQKVTNHPAENFMGKCKLKKKLRKGEYMSWKKKKAIVIFFHLITQEIEILNL